MRSVLLVAALVTACGSDSVLGPHLTVGELAGSWSLTRWELINAANSAQRTDLMPVGGGAVLAMYAPGAFIFTIFIPDLGSLVVQRGTVTIRGDTLTYQVTTTTVTPYPSTVADAGRLESDTVLFVMRLTGNVMSWRTIAIQPIDMDGDGVPEETVEELIFEQN